MNKKKIIFTKKIEDVGLKKKEIKAFDVCAICGFCGMVDKYTKVINPKEYGWMFMEEFNGKKVNHWFCSERCYNKQIKSWKKTLIRNLK